MEKVLEYHLSGKDWLDENRALFDRLKVRAENREAERIALEGERRKKWAEKRWCTVFDRSQITRLDRLGEDFTFCRRLLKAGLEVTIDTGLFIGHVGDYSYGPWDMEPGQIKKPD